MKLKLVGFIKGRPARLTYVREVCESGAVMEHISSSTVNGMGDTVFQYVEKHRQRLLALGRMYASKGEGIYHVDLASPVQWEPSKVPRPTNYSIRTSQQLCADVGFTL